MMFGSELQGMVIKHLLLPRSRTIADYRGTGFINADAPSCHLGQDWSSPVSAGFYCSKQPTQLNGNCVTASMGGAGGGDKNKMGTLWLLPGEKLDLLRSFSWVWPWRGYQRPLNCLLMTMSRFCDVGSRKLNFIRIFHAEISVVDLNRLWNCFVVADVVVIVDVIVM